MIEKATRVALPASILPTLLLISTMMGMDPVMSITAKSTMKVASVSLISNPMILRFILQKYTDLPNEKICHLRP